MRSSGRTHLLRLFLIAACWIACSVGTAKAARAEGWTLCPCPGTERCICDLQPGQPSPWAGYLFSPLAAQAADAETARLEERFGLVLQAERDRGLARLTAEASFWQGREAEAAAELDRLRHPPWYRAPGFLLGAGTTTGALASLGLFLLLGVGR